ASKSVLSKPAAKDTASKSVLSTPTAKDTASKPVLSKSAAKDSVAKPEASNAADKDSLAPQGKANGKTNSSGSAVSKKKQANHAAQVHASGGDGLIPPPPAFQPSYLLNPSGGMGVPFQVEYMTKEMMQQRLKDVQQQFGDAKSQLEDMTAQLKEKKERAERF